MDLSAIISVAPTEYRRRVYVVALTPGNAFRISFHATKALPGAQEMIRWQFTSDAPVLLGSEPYTQPMVCTSHASHWATPEHWRDFILQCADRPVTLQLLLDSVSPGGVDPDLRVLSNAPMSTLTAEHDPITGSHTESRTVAAELAPLPPAEAKPTNPTRLAKFDRIFCTSKFELESPSGAKTVLDAHTFSRRYLPSVKLGDCEDGQQHDLRSPGHPLWKFKKLV